MSKPKPRILVITFSRLSRDARVLRQVEFLSHIENTSLTVAAIGPNPLNDKAIRYLELPRNLTFSVKVKSAIQLKLRNYSAFDPGYGASNHLYKCIQGEVFDLILANDINTLTTACNLRGISTSIFLDAHEYSPRQHDELWMFRFFLKGYYQYVCKNYLPQVDAMTTVCEGLADAYYENYQIRPEVIINAPFYQDMSPHPVNQDCIRLIHHGGVSPSRGQEELIKLMEMLDERFHLDLMFVMNDKKYYEYLKTMAKTIPRVRFIDPVKPDEICNVINSYDIGIYMLKPVNFNYTHALPNKILDHIQARLALAIWPTPGMRKVVEKYQCGIVSDEYTIESMADCLNGLSIEDIMMYKENSDRAAHELNANNGRVKFTGMVEKLLGK